MSEKITIHKAAFDFQIGLLLEHSVERMRLLYENEGVAKTDMQVFVVECITELQQAIKIVPLDPTDKSNTATTERIDLVDLFTKLAHQKFKHVKDNQRELCFFQMLAYIALYNYHMGRKNYSDALTSITYASFERSKQGYVEFAGKIALSERAVKSGKQKGISQKTQTLNYMKELLISRQWKTRDVFFNAVADEVKEKLDFKISVASIKRYFYQDLSEAERNVIERGSKTIMSQS